MATDLESAQREAPPLVPVGGLEPLAGAGVTLTKWVLMILAAMLVLLISAVFYQEKQFTDLFGASLRTDSAPFVVKEGQPNGVRKVGGQSEMLKTYQEVMNASREFWMKLGQMILLNLLLPVLTALLGYVFGSKQASR